MDVPAFAIGFTKAPPPDGRTPNGDDAFAAIAQNGAVFHRCGPPPGKWGPDAERDLDHVLDRSAKAGIRAAVYLPDLTAFDPGDTAVERELRRVVSTYRDHPGFGFWKGEDEPEWNGVPVRRIQRFYDVVREFDDRHPVWITQAPRGTIESLAPYDRAYDIGAIDIYPVSYPPGLHSHLPNKRLSVVGDYTRWIRQVTAPAKTIWMTLQIAWSGVIKPGKTLRFPTFPEQRFMAYQAIVNGARGLIYFGGNLPQAMNERDRALGWNWTYYDRVLLPLLEEFRPGSPLSPALIAPDSPARIQAEGAEDVEFCVREAAGHLFILAIKREGPEALVRFSGLPAIGGRGDLLYEDPRQVVVSDGTFVDWFGPNEVHAYRFPLARGGDEGRS